jgi:signal transduction histidine kinase/DNA-binding response OmpR family regulator/streptogramin lyase
MGGGLKRFDRDKKQFFQYSHDAKNVSSLSSNGVFSIYEDNTNVLWVGTYAGGLNKFDRDKEQFIHYFNDRDDPSSLCNNTVFSICEDSFGDLWVGTYDCGLNKYDREKEQFTNYFYDPDNPASLSDNDVLSIYEDNSGLLWVGTYGGGLNKYDRKKEQFTIYAHNPNDRTSLSKNEIFTIIEDNFGDLWIGTDGGGLNNFNKEKEQFTHYIHDPNNPASLSANRVFSIFEDKSGILWIGTDVGGLNKFDREKKQFTYYKYDPDDPSSLSNNAVLSIYEDKSGVLWIGTYGGGLNKFNSEKEQFTHYRETDGLPNDVIFGILEDEYGNLWLSTNKGISRFTPGTGLFRNYDVRDGIQGNEFNQGAYHKSKNGNMFFGGINGLTKFHPDSVKDNPHITPIVITGFQLFNKPVPIGIDTSNNRLILKKSITGTKEIELTYKDYVISFEFAALDFHIPEKNQYAYIMEGFDKDWTYTNADRRFVTYTNLDPGEYTFRVKGSNNDGIWNDEGTALIILITPPLWATTWAYIFYGIFIIFLFISARTYDLKRQRLKHQLELEHEHAKKLEEVDQMKSRFFTNISHEFRTPLTLILGPSENIIKETSKEEIKKKAGTIKKNANRLLSLINQLLDLSKLDAGRLKLEASCGNIVTFVKGIAMSFESVGERKDILLKIKTTNNEIEVYFDRDKMEKILTNLFSNAFKFTPVGGKITVAISETDMNSVTIKIRDTGIGISEEEIPRLFDRFYQVDSSQTREHKGTGIGLSLTKELVELHTGTISVESREGEWTEVTITLPLGKEDLLPDEMVEADESKVERKILVDDEETITSSQFEKPLPEDFDKDKTIILVVEDNTDVREYIKESLGEDYQVEEAANGEQGVRKAENIIPDLIISDIMMPKMDGNELTRILKNDEKTSHIPIILLTAKTEHESKLEGLATGADDYLMKPFDTEELHIRIKNIIDNRRKLHKKFREGEYVSPRGKEKKLRSIDELFMNKIIEVIEQHISEEEFSIEEFGNEVGMSRSQLHRKLKALSGKSASRYIRSVRLARAKKKIDDQKGNISEIAYSVGFSSPAYFTKCFKDEYGYPPSDLVS